MYKMSLACYQPGWSRGPIATGAEPSNFQCELPGDHTGDHCWYTDENFVPREDAVYWPVRDYGEDED